MQVCMMHELPTSPPKLGEANFYPGVYADKKHQLVYKPHQKLD